MSKLSEFISKSVFIRPGIGRRFALYILAFSSIVTLVMTALQLTLEYKREVVGIEKLLEQVRISYSNSLAGSLWVISNDDIQLQLNGLLRLPDIQYLEVYSETNHIIAVAGKQVDQRVIRKEIPLYFSHRNTSHLVGKLIAVASLEGPYQHLKDKVIVILLSQGVKTFIVSIFILFLFQYLIGRHLNKIAQHSECIDTVATGRLLSLDRKNSPQTDKDDLSQLVNSINNMHSRLSAAFRLLQNSEENTRLMIEAVQDYAIVRFDNNGLVSSWNLGAERIFGYQAREIIGRHHSTFFIAEDITNNLPEQLLLQAHETGIAKNEGWRARKDQSQFLAECSITALYDSKKELRGYSIVVHDITERKQNQEQIKYRESLLRQTQSLAATGSWRIYLPDNTLVWSSETYRMFGIPDGTPVNYAKFIECVHPDDRESVNAAWQAALEGAPYHIQHRVVINGEIRWVDERGELEFNPKGELVTVTGATQDITARILFESEQLRLSRALRLLSDTNFSLLHANSEIMLLNDLCRLIVETGGYMMAWVGFAEHDAEKSVRPMAKSGYENGYLDNAKISWDENQAIGRGPTGTAIRTNTTQINHNALANPSMKPWLDAVSKRGYQSSIALPLIIHNKTLGALSIYASENDAFSADEVKLLEELASNVAFGIDSLTSQRQLYAAKSASQAKSAFLANMSHEIRTPLHAITGMAQLLRRSELSPQQLQKLDTIDTAGQHLLDIINSVLDLSKIEANKLSLEEAEFDVSAISSTVATMLADSAKAKKLILTVEPLAQTLYVIGDPTRLRQALLNYTSNAVKFTERGSISLRTIIKEQSDNDVLLQFEVQDTGIGISTEALQRLFSTFEQADNSTTRKYGGTGLGLAITKKLAQLMGGSAGVTSTPEKGSTFWFTARLKLATPAPAAVTNQPTTATDSELLQKFSGCKILIADDERFNRQLIHDILENLNPNIDDAENGAVAVELASKNSYDLILMDMQMPVLNGLDATRQIRLLKNHTHTPIIAMTGNAFSTDRLNCIEAGMSDFLAKPFKINNLFALLLKWLSQPHT